MRHNLRRGGKEAAESVASGSMFNLPLS
jgi:hypothetical protein